MADSTKPQSLQGGSSGHGRIHHGPYPELTWPAVLVGWLLGSLIAISIGYAALILGFSIEGSELAAILGWGILRGIMRRTSIVENNINQTIASAVNGASSGMMFSIPALFILNREYAGQFTGLTDFNPVLMVVACATGAIIGLSFVIPLRKQMIDFDRLAYPGGIAVATILKSPGAGVKKAMYLIGGGLASAIFYLLMIIFVGDHPNAHVGEALRLPPYLNLTFFLSLMTVGVGFLSGKGGYWFGAGGFICYFVLAPLMSHLGGQSVRERFDPPVSQAIVVKDDVSELKTIADDIKAHDVQAALFLTALAESATKQVDRFQLTGEPKTVARFLNDPTFDRIDEIHKSLLLLGENPTSHPAESEGESEERKSPDFGEHARKLAAMTRTPDVLAARKLLSNDVGEETAKVGEFTRASNLLNLLESTSSFEDHQKQSILRATRSYELYHGVPNDLRLSLFRPSGIGMLIGAAIGGIIAAFPLMLSAFGSLRDAAKDKSFKGDNDEMPLKLLIFGVVAGLAILVGITYSSVEDIGFGTALSMALLGTVWVWVAGVIVSECVGRTNWSPLSGMTLIAVTILIVIAKQGGMNDSMVIVASMFMGGAICVAISQSSDMMLYLKSGYLIGAQPRMQQWGQVIGTWLGPIIVMALIFILDRNTGLGTDALPAPQGKALASVIQGIIGEDVPTYRYVAGGGLGTMLALSGLGGIGVQVGLGFYMPFNVVLTYTIGCTARVLFNKYADRGFVEGTCVPIAAGLIVGEALVGVGNAIYQIFFA